MYRAPRNTKAYPTNFRQRRVSLNVDRAQALADAIVRLTRHGHSTITDSQLTQQGFTLDEIRQFGDRARSLAGHKLNRTVAA
jgi:hypothetical protein